VKLLIEDVVRLGPVASLALVLGAFAVGVALSVRADRREARRHAKPKTKPSTA
jgi:Kef-type K+ transport system membrane component KefB